MIDSKEWADVYVKDSKLKTAGDVVHRPKLAHTLRQLAKHGADAFYSGPIAHSMVKSIRKAGGKVTLDDLAKYTVKVEPAETGTYRNSTLYFSPAPAAGPVLMHLLNILEPLNLADQDLTPLNVHRASSRRSTRLTL